jgi:hypothetical protein
MLAPRKQGRRSDSVQSQMGPLFLLIFVADTLMATLAWVIVGLFLN